MPRKSINTWYSAEQLNTVASARRAGETRELVGVIAPNYGLEHLTYLLNLPDYAHVKLRRIPFHRLERGGTFFDINAVLIRTGLRLVHTFNHLPVNGGPFVNSFESELPFYLGPHREWQHRIGHRLLASDRCKALLSISEIAARNARAKFTDLGLPEVVDKMEVFRGAVRLSTETEERRYSEPNEPLRVLLVGLSGFHKGVVPLLDAVEQLRRDGAEIELTVIATLPPTAYVLDGVELPVEETARRLEDSPWITWHQAMPNAEVRAAMFRHDLLALPSLDESLGWVVVEAAMEGTAAISSNVFALPELVEDGVSGRLMRLPLREDGRWSGLGTRDRETAWAEARSIFQSGLVDAIGAAAADRDLPRRWGEAARARAMRTYHPDVAAAALGAIYDRALAVS